MAVAGLSERGTNGVAPLGAPSNEAPWHCRDSKTKLRASSGSACLSSVLVAAHDGSEARGPVQRARSHVVGVRSRACQGGPRLGFRRPSRNLAAPAERNTLARMTHTVGRNEPCPCGSGRKYKRCHGASSAAASISPRIARANALKAIDAELTQRLLRFARRRYGADWLPDVLDGQGGLEGPAVQLLVPWMLHLMPGRAGGLTVARAWRRDERPRLTDDEIAVLDAYEAAWISPWEVAEVEHGVGATLTDQLTGEERFAHDVRASSTLGQYDTLLALILTCDDVSFFGGAHAQPLPPMFAERMVRAARRLCRVRTRAVPVDRLRHPEIQLGLLALWSRAVDDMIQQPPPIMQNTDGDPLVLTTEDFALLAPRHDVEKRLAVLPGAGEAEADGENTVFVVTKPGNTMRASWDNTIVGRIVVSATRLRAETNSARRADALRATLESNLQGLVLFRLRKEENTAQLIAEARESHTPPPEREPLSPEMSATVREFRERQMAGWIDESIPALGGLTPRQAAASPKARPKLATLLKEFVQHEARLPEEERIDLGCLRSALGFSDL